MKNADIKVVTGPLLPRAGNEGAVSGLEVLVMVLMRIGSILGRFLLVIRVLLESEV